jgi:hypothetical protein
LEEQEDEEQKTERIMKEGEEMMRAAIQTGNCTRNRKNGQKQSLLLILNQQQVGDQLRESAHLTERHADQRERPCEGAQPSELLLRSRTRICWACICRCKNIEYSSQKTFETSTHNSARTRTINWQLVGCAHLPLVWRKTFFSLSSEFKL